MNLWALPVSARLGEREFPHASDFRAMLKILSVLGSPAGMVSLAHGAGHVLR